jgi:2-polyprenyl-3-methyl-5-hydroxy-6-metoxy-1,4-benzoquinol methylase
MNEWKSSATLNDCVFTTPLPSEKILRIVDKKTARVLDLGCGYGRTLKSLHDMGYENLTGIDISLSLINRATDLCPEAEYHVGSLKNLNLSGEYDLILLMGVIEYILSDDEQKILFKEVSKLLSANGHVFLETFVMDRLNLTDYVRGYLRTLHWGRFKNSKGFESHHQSVATIMEILREHFDIVRATREHYLTWSNNTCNGFTALLKKL